MRIREQAESDFWDKAEKMADGCWQWTGARSASGYGYSFWRDDKGAGRNMLAHRLAFMLSKGDGALPRWRRSDGGSAQTIDHICRNRGCVNPEHLRVVSQHDNVLFGDAFSARNAAKTHCLRGHELTERAIYRINGKRVCRACHSIRRRKVPA